MQKNVSEREARVRTVIAAVVVLVALFFVENSTVKIVLALVAAILAGTAFLNTCPLRSLVGGKNTCEAPEAAEPAAPASTEDAEAHEASEKAR